MNGDKIECKVRGMTLEDLDAIFAIDHRLRETAKVITYANLPTERIFAIDRHVGRLAKPISYADLITKDISGLLKFGLVAEINGHVRGFILGRITRVGEASLQEGLILILGVHPDYWQKGIGTQLVNEICIKFRSIGIKKVRIEIDQRDKYLLNFMEQMGFNVGHLIVFTKTF